MDSIIGCIVREHVISKLMIKVLEIICKCFTFLLVVSIDLFCSQIVHFPTMEYIESIWCFLLMTSQLVKKVPMENESSISLGGTIILLALFVQKTPLGKYFFLLFFGLQLMRSQRKLYMDGICSTVRKRAKRTWDTTVKDYSQRLLMLHTAIGM